MSLLLHLSAGIGRTGTYLALDILTEQGQTLGYVDAFDCVTKLRQQRVSMVQTRVHSLQYHLDVECCTLSFTTLSFSFFGMLQKSNYVHI